MTKCLLSARDFSAMSMAPRSYFTCASMRSEAVARALRRESDRPVKALLHELQKLFVLLRVHPNGLHQGVDDGTLRLFYYRLAAPDSQVLDLNPFFDVLVEVRTPSSPALPFCLP